ncbi:MAG: glycosyltransferase [Nitrospira sp.]|nr:glycosyltransferase [Nitrospira sp.]
MLAQRNSYKGVFIQEAVIDWNVPLFQRPQHIAAALGRLGYLVIYKTFNLDGDNVDGFREVAKNVWLTNKNHVNKLENVVRLVCSTDFVHTPDLLLSNRKSGLLIYDYIDRIDPQITGADSIQRLIALKDFAFSGGADYIVASARQLEAEAVEAVGRDKVILIQNGVDARHYRDPTHETTDLSPDFVAFKSQYSNVVGYFGAIAPWLWYEAIAELVERRKDLGFVFIGPNYTGGLDHLPTSENVLYLGVVEYNVLPAYGRQFDVCIIPFAPGEIARTTSPLKLFEYFALEKPVVVTSEMVECVAFKEVFSGDSATAISQAIDKAITVKADPELKRRLAQLADENGWDERVRNMELFT